MDLDGTLAFYDEWRGPDHIGEPIPEMMDRVKRWISEGRTVKLFTARASIPHLIPPVRTWLDRHGLKGMEITCVKDFFMLELWDDRCVQVVPNTGKPVVEAFIVQES